MRESTARIGVLLGVAGLMLFPVTSFAAARPHHHSSTHAVIRRTVSARSTHTEHAYAGLTMGSERATEIQAALIKKGYLSGEPTGSWDATSFAAMQKLQGDNGWQTKLVPDSRALIKLGLGPGTTPTVPASPTATAALPSMPATTVPGSTPFTY